MTSLYKEAVARRCSVRKMFLKMSQNSQEDTCARVFFLIKLKKRLWHRCFFVNFTKLKILKTFFIEHLRWLILYIKSRLFIVGNKTQWFIFFSTIYFKRYGVSYRLDRNSKGEFYSIFLKIYLQKSSNSDLWHFKEKEVVH